MASAANAPSEQENRDPDRPRITRRNRGDYTRSTPLDLEYLQRPSYCDAGFALEQITEVLISHLCLWGGKISFFKDLGFIVFTDQESGQKLCPVAAR